MRKQKEKKEKKLTEQMPVESRTKMFVILLGFALWALILVYWFAVVVQLGDFSTETNSPDGLTKVTEQTKTDNWEGAVGSDYDKLPPIEDGFGDVEKAQEVQYFGDQAYTASTTLYVITTQKPSELGIDSKDVTEDGKGYFTWSKDSIYAGMLDINTKKESLALLYPEDCERLKEYIDNEDYYWYTLTLQTTETDIVKKDNCGDVVKDIFGMKLDPSRSVILYSGGYVYKKAG